MECTSGRWMFGIGLLLGASVAVWFGFLITAPSPGSLEEAFSRVRADMSQDEAVASFKKCSVGFDAVHFSGVTKDGREFYKCWFDDIPPSWEVVYSEFYVADDHGNEAEIFFEQGGRVSGMRYTPSDPPGERLLKKVGRALDHKVIRKTIGRKACELLRLN